MNVRIHDYVSIQFILQLVKSGRVSILSVEIEENKQQMLIKKTLPNLTFASMMHIYFKLHFEICVLRILGVYLL